MIDWYRASLRWAFSRASEPARVRVPVHVVWGRRDKLLDASMVAPSLALCDAGRVTWFDDATHWVLHEERARIIELMQADFRS